MGSNPTWGSSLLFEKEKKWALSGGVDVLPCFVNLLSRSPLFNYVHVSMDCIICMYAIHTHIYTCTCTYPYQLYMYTYGHVIQALSSKDEVPPPNRSGCPLL